MSIRVAIIGCGKIADQHVAAIGRIPQSEIVALCDREILMAKQLGERFQIDSCFGEVSEMLSSIKPDVVHITTPPQSHESLALQCLAAGAHVYLEKPFTVTAQEAENVISAANAAGLRVTAGHNYQFTREMCRMRQMIQDGFFGKAGQPAHVESHWSYDLGDTAYVRAMLSSSNHWVRQLPGQLFHNVISHGVAKLAEFLDDEIVELNASAHQSPRLASLGGGEVMDELRVYIRDGKGTTAEFCFSTQFKPSINLVWVLGETGSLKVDIIDGSLVKRVGRSYKSYLTYFLPPFLTALEYAKVGFGNIIGFLRRQLYQDFGMKELIERFHSSITDGPTAPDPIPMREIQLTSRIMDEIFAQVYSPSGGEGTVKPIRSESDGITRETGSSLIS